MAVTQLTRRSAAYPTRHPPVGRRRWRTALLVLLTASGIAAVGYGTLGTTLDRQAPRVGPRTVESSGPVAGSTARVAVLARDDRVVAYVSTGDPALGEQFSGTLVGDRAVLRSAGGAELLVDIDGDAAIGSFTPAGSTTAHPFRAVPAPDPVLGVPSSDPTA
jgi:hypothetical protein